MGYLVVEKSRSFNGPWLIDREAIESLDKTIQQIEAILHVAFEQSIEKTVSERITQLQDRGNKEIDKVKVKEMVLESYTFQRREKYVLISTEEGNKIKDESLSQILKDKTLELLTPIGLSLSVVKGECSFRMSISKNLFHDTIDTDVLIDGENLLTDINFEIDQWLIKNKPSNIVQKWSTWFPTAIFPIFFGLVIIMALFFDNPVTEYKESLKAQSHEMLKDGLSDQEVKKAIEILLVKESDYYPIDFTEKSESNKVVLFTCLGIMTASLILCIRPKTVIGLGKNSSKVIFYKKWTKFILVTLPFGIFLPYLIRKFL